MGKLHAKDGKIRAGQAYAYGTLFSFKTSVTYRKKFNFTPDNCVGFEAAFINMTRFFAGNCPMSVASIKA